MQIPIDHCQIVTARQFVRQMKMKSVWSGAFLPEEDNQGEYSHGLTNYSLIVINNKFMPWVRLNPNSFLNIGAQLGNPSDPSVEFSTLFFDGFPY